MVSIVCNIMFSVTYNINNTVAMTQYIIMIMIIMIIMIIIIVIVICICM